MTDMDRGAQAAPEHSESMTLEDALRVIRELRKENAERRTRAKSLETSLAEREQKELEAQKNWEALASKYKTELDEVRARASVADELETAMRETLEARVKALPKQFQNAVPDLGSPARTLKWLDANSHLFKMPDPPNMNAGEQGDAGQAAMTEDVRRLAGELGLSMDRAAEYLKRGQR